MNRYRARILLVTLAGLAFGLGAVIVFHTPPQILPVLVIVSLATAAVRARRPARPYAEHRQAFGEWVVLLILFYVGLLILVIASGLWDNFGLINLLGILPQVLVWPSDPLTNLAAGSGAATT
jgi:hypothetical protein